MLLVSWLRNKLPEWFRNKGKGGKSDLEELVKVRSGELVRMNEKLKEEIEERGRVEAQLRRAKEAAEAANVAKSQFLDNMSHEIRTPMNGIIGFTQIALQSELAPEQRKYLTMVKKSADNLMEIIEDILDFSKLDSGKVRLNLVNFALREFLSGLIKDFSREAADKGLRLEYGCAQGVEDLVLGDRERLRQVLGNLLDNALKFTERGRISLRVSREGAGERAGALHFSVGDSGIGIPREKLRSIFNPFSQVDGSATRKYGGTGLGLTICAQLVGLMGGRIWAESEPGRGSTFHFTARLEQGEEKSAGPEVSLPSILQNLPVLVVDDDLINLNYIQQLLKSWRMNPTVLSNVWSVTAVLDLASRGSEPFSLLIIKERPGDTEARGVVGEIRENPALEDIRIVLIADYEGCEGAEFDKGEVDACLPYSFSRSALMNAILFLFEARASRTRECAKDAPGEKKRPGADGGRPLRVLLVEDTLINQEMGKALLAAWGHKVTLAVNGREALDILEREAFDLVLMDVQMPVMDGLEATRRIRSREKERGGGHVNIVAMTAHALARDRAICLAAGMDDYISKPIDAGRLSRLVERFEAGRRKTPGDAEGPEEEKGRGEELFDRRELLRRVSGKPELLRSIVTLFTQNCPSMLADIRRAVAGGDSEALNEAAHAFKGSVSNFSAAGAVRLAAELERMGREGDLGRAAEVYEGLEREAGRLKPALEDFVGGLRHG